MNFQKYANFYTTIKEGTPEHCKLEGWKTIEDLIQYELQIIVYKSRNGLTPRYRYNMFAANSSDSSYNLQNTATDLKL